MVVTSEARRRLLQALLGTGMPCTAVLPSVAAATKPKVLRVALQQAPSGFDPASVGDSYAYTVISHIFEPLFTYDPLARPVKLVPLVAAAPAEPTDDYSRWIVRIRPGIFFADHPAFDGRKRELTAADFVYSIKRLLDPATRSPGRSLVTDLGLLGVAEHLRDAGAAQGGFSYQRPIAGLLARDRHTLQLRTDGPRPRLPLTLALGALGAVAHELVAAYGRAVGEHPVGTGPFRLAQWRRGSLVVLERNPGYRDRRYHAEPAADDAQGQAIARRLAGRRLPMVDRVEISAISEEQPRWLEFIGGRLDHLDVPGGYAAQAMPGGVLAPHLARRGVSGQQTAVPGVRLTFFNMRNATVGGYAPAQVALRRAIALGMNCERDIRLVDSGLGRVAHTVFAPHQSGFDPGLRSEMGLYDPVRARALLDVYGYVDRDGDGWRERPDGSPLMLEMAAQNGQRDRGINEGFERDMRALGLRLTLRIGELFEHAKSARAGQLMMWTVGLQATMPDGHESLTRYHSKSEAFAQFELPAMDRLCERIGSLPDGPERLALMRQAERLAIAWMPYKVRLLRVETHLTQPRLVGYRRPLFRRDWFHLVDLVDLV